MISGAKSGEGGGGGRGIEHQRGLNGKGWSKGFVRKDSLERDYFLRITAASFLLQPIILSSLMPSVLTSTNLFCVP